nr:facilitated trehalose transporter Tret1-like [Halyomorpha halys]
MGTAIPMIVSWTIMYSATTVNFIYIARFIGGISIGAVCASIPVYLVEIAEDSIRGRLGSLFQSMTVTGVLYAYVIAVMVPYTELPLFCGALNIIFLILFFKAPESPMYLMQKGRRCEAEDALIFLRGKRYNVHKELEAMEKDINSKKAEKKPFFKELSKRSSILALLVSLTLMFLQQMTGINAVVFFMESVFEEADSALDPALSTIVAGVAQVLATLWSTALIDYTGRKILLQVSSSVMALCLAVLGYYFYEKENAGQTQFGSIPVVAVVLFIVTYSIGFGPIPWLISGEIMPPEVKGVGLGVVASFKWLCAFAVTKAFLPINDALGPATSYWIFTCLCVAAFFFSTFVLIETKGKSLYQIQEEMFGDKDKRNKMKISNAIV